MAVLPPEDVFLPNKFEVHRTNFAVFNVKLNRNKSLTKRFVVVVAAGHLYGFSITRNNTKQKQFSFKTITITIKYDTFSKLFFEWRRKEEKKRLEISKRLNYININNVADIVCWCYAYLIATDFYMLRFSIFHVFFAWKKRLI